MRGQTLIAALLGLVGFVTAGADELLPSETTTLMVRAIYSQPDADRTTITGPLMERMKTADLDAVQRFLAGEAHFLNFEPQPARDRFREFRDHQDDFGRAARQRLAIIRINAFSMVDEVVEQDIPAYRSRFPISAHDRYGISYPLMRAARQLAARGEPEQALDLVADEVRRHNTFDAPYFAYRLPQAFMTLAIERGREAEFRELLDWVVDGVSAELERRLSMSPVPDRRAYSLPGAMLGTLFEDERLDYHDWTGEFLALRASLASNSR